MTVPSAREIAAYCDTLLDGVSFPDYAGALNGLQLDNTSPISRIASAVDFSRRTVDATISGGANLLIVHHGMFWGGAQRLVGPIYDRLRLLFHHDIAVYASHLPLDAHPEVGNNALMARALALEPTSRFGAYQGVPLGVAGEGDVATAELLVRAQSFAESLGGGARASWMEPGRRTRRWAVITGAGAGSDELRAAALHGIDTLIVGEGAHHTTVNAPETGLVIIYAGHYATETLGVRALAAAVGRQFALPHDFLFLPTGS